MTKWFVSLISLLSLVAYASEPASYGLSSIDSTYNVGGVFGKVQLQISLTDSYHAASVRIKDARREIILSKEQIDQLDKVKLGRTSIMNSDFLPKEVTSYHVCIPFGESSYLKIGETHRWYNKVFVVSVDEGGYKFYVIEPPDSDVPYISRSGCHVFLEN